MAKELTVRQKRDAEILYAAMTLVNETGQCRWQDIKSTLTKRIKFTEKELEPTNAWTHRWHSIVGMGFLDLRDAGFVTMGNGFRYITPEGQKALLGGPYEMYKAMRAEIKKRRAIKNPDTPVAVEVESDENVALATIEDKKSDADEGIRNYIKSLTPEQFQDLVAALLHGMGFYTSFVADKGPDGGIDIIAHQDPLGARPPKVIVQVKHTTVNAIISNDVAIQLNGTLSKDCDEIGVVVTNGIFSRETKKICRISYHRIRLIDIDEFVELWIKHYHNMTEEDRNLMPLTPIYYIAK